MPPRDRRRRSLLFGWWYVSIGIGFVLLAVNRIVLGDRTWSMVLRFLIAAGFFVLGYHELRGRR